MNIGSSETNGTVLSPDENGQLLLNHLTIQPPEDPGKTPPILSFSRKRSVEIPWGELIEKLEPNAMGSISAIKSYFEDSWDLVDSIEELFVGESLLIKNYISFLSESTKAYLPTFDGEDGGLSSGLILKHGISGRLYLVRPLSGQEITKADFSSLENYQKVWEEKVEGVELVFSTKEEADARYTSFEEIDLRPAFIIRKYQELKILRAMANTIQTETQQVSRQKLINEVGANMSLDEIEEIINKGLRLEMTVFDIDTQIKALAARAANLGYLLYLGPNTDDRVEGNLYTTHRRVVKWTTSHTRKETYHKKGFLGIKVKKTRKVRYSKVHSKIVQEFKQVDTNKDLLGERIQYFLNEGMEPYVFEKTGEGFVTLEGIGLGQVMDQCELSEGFRRTCVIMLPVYEDSLTGDRVITKYSVFLRPLKGITPAIIPQLSIEESLTYRSAWCKTILGELTSSINLAPGEERTVTISKEYERETTINTSSTSVFDLSTTESRDLSSEMQNQTRRDSERNVDLRLESKVKGGGLTFSAEASASAGVNTSLKQMSESISKTAQKAASSLSKQQREEISTSSSSRTKITNRNQSSAVLKNINQGRTLNMLFYRLYNQYRGGLFLENLQFNVVSSIEVIAGSGVHESHTYSLKECREMLEEFSLDKLPFPFKEDKGALLNGIAESIGKLLTEEYGIEERKKKGSFKPNKSVKLLKMASESNFRNLQNPVEALCDRLETAELSQDEPMVPQDLMVLSKGLYMDTVVGALASTEPYSERMREQEIRLRSAEVALKEAEAYYQRSRALYLHAGENGHDDKGKILGQNKIIAIMPERDGRSMQINLAHPLMTPASKWTLVINGKSVREIKNEELSKDRMTLVLTWTRPQPWVAQWTKKDQTELFHREADVLISY